MALFIQLSYSNPVQNDDSIIYHFTVFAHLLLL